MRPTLKETYKPMWWLVLDRGLALIAFAQFVYYSLAGFGFVKADPITSYLWVGAMSWFACRWLWREEKP